MALGALGKNIQNKAGTVDYAYLEQALEISLLRRGQRVIENGQIKRQISDRVPDFLGFARPHEKRRIRRRAPARYTGDRLGTGRF
jgi:hypothetical protein